MDAPRLPRPLPQPLTAGRKADTSQGAMQRKRVSVRQEENSALLEKVSPVVRNEAKDINDGTGQGSVRSSETGPEPTPRALEPPLGTPPCPKPPLGASPYPLVLVFLPENHFQLRTVSPWNAIGKLTEETFSGLAWPGKGVLEGCSSAGAP